MRLSRKRLFLRDHGRCRYCATSVLATAYPTHPQRATRDHFIPRSKGGPHQPFNILLACYACNRIKGDADPRVMVLNAVASFDLDPTPAAETYLRLMHEILSLKDSCEVAVHDT